MPSHSRFSLWTPILALLLWALMPSLSLAQEQILDYRVHISVNLDRSIDVVETIQVDVKGRQIKRGILRDLVVRYKKDDGTPLDLDVSKIKIERDGQPEPFETSYTGRYLRMKIGQADRYLSHRSHTYRISYRVEDFVSFFKDVDEVYWNAIGTGWAFPIKRASVSLSLPEGGKILQSVIYTGREGSTAQEGSLTKQSATFIEYKANRPLKVGEGMTIAVGWKKGLIKPATKEELQMKALIKNSPFYGLILLALGNFVWFYRSWSKWGKDPHAGTIIPHFHPPKDISPALASYIHGVGHFVGSNQKAFMASLVSLSIKGFLRLDKSGKKLKVHRSEQTRPTDLQSLPVGEKRLMGSLFYDNLYREGSQPQKIAGRDKVTFSDLSYSVMSKAMGSFTSDIEVITKEKYFNRNSGAAIRTLIFAFIALAGFIGATIALDPYNATSITLAIVGIIAGGAISRVWALWRSNKAALIGFAIFIAALGNILYNYFIVEGMAVPTIDLIDLLVLVVFSGIALLVPIAFEVMKAPTKEGQRIIDELNGLKLFMTVAIADKVNAMGQPDLTPDLYEELLPYAVALGVDKQWTQNFETLVFSQMAPGHVYDPVWYEGDYRDGRFSSSDLEDVTSAVSSDLSKGLTSPASSRSGSGGGGSSGGGGGGGGGSGW